MTNKSIDVVFIVRLEPRTDTGDPSLYKPLRLWIDGEIATIPLLRQYVGNEKSLGFSHRLAEQRRHFGGEPVLTPYLLKEYFESCGISFEVIPCLESGWDRLRELGKSGVRVVALSTTWARGIEAAPLYREAARKIKQELPGVVIVAGGIGVEKGIYSRRLVNEGAIPVSEEALAEMYLGIDAKSDKDFDCLVFGNSSEGTLRRIIERLHEGKDFRDLPNLALPNGGSYRINETADVEGALRDTIIDWHKYYREMFPFWTPVFSSVGCPHQCQFCDFHPLFKCKYRSEANLIDELKTIKRNPYPRFAYFTDDNFGINKKRLTTVLQAMVREKLGIKWHAMLRADMVDREMAEQLREAGCRELLLGIESGDPMVLSNINKRLDLDAAARALAHLDQAGINTFCTFIIGFPGETQKSIDNTVQWISNMPSGSSAHAYHRYYLFRLIISPLSPLSRKEQREKYGLQGLQEHWSHRTMNSEEAGHALKDMFLRIDGPTHVYHEPPVPDWPVHVTREIMELREKAQRKFCQGDATGQVVQDELLRKVQEANRKYTFSPITRMGLRLYYRLKGISL
ncbi:MAG: radical SAM protein [Pirellulales bacterium]|nr:radical SAM protein [Pirellulales bacterium]